MAKQGVAVKRDVEEAAFSVPAVLCNWFVMSRHPIGVRLALGERATADSELAVRGAYVLALQDAVVLRDLLNAALEHSSPPPRRPH